ncbi:MAG: hypothetical protein R2822_05125 [Spirosomataceae bacterium]
MRFSRFVTLTAGRAYQPTTPFRIFFTTFGKKQLHFAMKKHFLTFALTLSTFALLAQNEDYQHVISAQSGVSLFSPFRGTVQGSTAATDTIVSFSSGQMNNFPQLNLGYDYGVVKWFSIGGSMSYNKVGLDLKDVKYNKTENIGDVNLAVSRITIGARALFHYGNANRVDMYSGVRLGVGIWTVKVKSKALDDKLDDVLKEAGGSGIWRSLIGNRVKGSFPMFQAQVVLFGLRGYLTENIGINGELSVGSPYFASIGVNYRFGNPY